MVPISICAESTYNRQRGRYAFVPLDHVID